MGSNRLTQIVDVLNVSERFFLPLKTFPAAIQKPDKFRPKTFQTFPKNLPENPPKISPKPSHNLPQTCPKSLKIPVVLQGSCRDCRFMCIYIPNKKRNMYMKHTQNYRKEFLSGVRYSPYSLIVFTATQTKVCFRYVFMVLT